MANSIDYTIYMDAQAVVDRFAAGAMGIDSYINSALVNAAYQTKEEMKANAPEGVGAAMGAGIKNSIVTEFNVEALGEKSVTIKPNVPYAAAVETGSKPHWPPVDPDGALAQWCEMKGLNLMAVAASIARKGTKPHPYVEPTYETMQKTVPETFSLGVKQYLEAL